MLRTYQQQVEAALTGLPGGARGFLVMTLVERETCQSQAAIAERIGLDKTILTYLLDGLEKEGLVTRTPDPQDRRIRHINLTAKGQKTLAGLTRTVEGVEKQVLARLAPEEAAWFQRSIARAAGLDSDNSRPSGQHDSVEICQAALGAGEAC
ncbi:transcriptional regulator, MarR family [Pelagibacterium halotolerans B2]|uniref:Transcriptional regulator, MarR family n=1 Tax=Pelagibacterium halotolerans (strain DSM 22347 / JCM 15775 / CGMCC 1.7692 / B2) TaxID=1082931 RepID=G4RF21_PELHB|nr:transcriptional regulator, MarR family [Pelagibacterium halotolerans B2]